MPGAKYEQLSLKSDADEDVFTSKPKTKWSEICFQKGLLSLGLILLYFSLSIGLTFYQRWLLTDFKFPLTVVMYHLIVKWILSVIVRLVLYLVTGTPQLLLPCMTCLRSVGPTGLASGIDVGFSNWGLELVTISLYTMTKSTTIIFILGFAILLGLEKKSWSLVGIVFMIAIGLIMFTYKATQFNLLGFNFLLIASFAAGLRWTFAQLLMQKSKLGLHNPVDMVFHVQPWMFVSLLPFTIMFEGFSCFDFLQKLMVEELMPTVLKVTVGATIAFAMEISEFLVVTYTSSLTLSISGIFKEMCILVLAVEVSGDVLSPINVAGLSICLLGIIGHIIHKVLFIKSVAGTVHAIDDDFEIKPKTKVKGEYGEPLLEEQAWPPSEDSDYDSNVVLFEVLQRRDGSSLTTGCVRATPYIREHNKRTAILNARSFLEILMAGSGDVDYVCAHTRDHQLKAMAGSGDVDYVCAHTRDHQLKAMRQQATRYLAPMKAAALCPDDDYLGGSLASFKSSSCAQLGGYIPSIFSLTFV